MSGAVPPYPGMSRTRLWRGLGVVTVGSLLAASAGGAPTQAAEPAGAVRVGSASVDTVAGPDFCQGRGRVDPRSREVGALAVDRAGRVFFDTGQSGAVGVIAPDGGASLKRGVPAATTSADGRSGSAASAARMAPGIDGSFVLASGGRIVEIDIGLAAVAGDPTLAPGAAGAASSGDGGPYGAARFVRVVSVTSDDKGNLYAAEEIDPTTRTLRIRFLNRSPDPVTFYPGTAEQLTVDPGAIATIAGGAGLPGQQDSGSARTALLQGAPPALAVAGSRLYLALSAGSENKDDSAARIAMVNLGGDQLPVHGVTVAPGGIAIVAGDGTDAQAGSPLSYVPGVAADDQGNLYLAEEASDRVLRLDREGTLTVFAGRGRQSTGVSGPADLATAARLDRPVDVDVGPDGRVYISDRGNGAVRVVDATGTIRSAGGEGLALTAQCVGPSGTTGELSAATLVLPDRPVSISSNGRGEVYMALAAGERVKRLDGTGEIRDLENAGLIPAAPAAGPVGLPRPGGVATGPEDNLYVIQSGVEGAFLTNLGSEPVQAHGKSLEPGSVQRVGGDSPAGSGQTGLAAELLPGASAVTADANGNVYIGSFAKVEMIDKRGAVTTIMDSPSPQGCCRIPLGLAVTGSGNVYLSDQLGNQVWFLNRGPSPVISHGVTVGPGALVAVVGDGSAGFGGDRGPASKAQLRTPASLALDRAGNLYIADANEHTIRRVDPQGIIDTVAGTGRQGFNGDGLDGRLTALNSPTSLAFDRCGNLLIADSGNGRVRRLNLVGNCPLTARAGQDSGATGLPPAPVGVGVLVVAGVAALLIKRRRGRVGRQ